MTNLEVVSAILIWLLGRLCEGFCLGLGAALAVKLIKPLR